MTANTYQLDQVSFGEETNIQEVDIGNECKHMRIHRNVHFIFINVFMKCLKTTP